MEVTNPGLHISEQVEKGDGKQILAHHEPEGLPTPPRGSAPILAGGCSFACTAKEGVSSGHGTHP